MLHWSKIFNWKLSTFLKFSFFIDAFHKYKGNAFYITFISKIIGALDTIFFFGAHPSDLHPPLWTIQVNTIHIKHCFIKLNYFVHMLACVITRIINAGEILFNQGWFQNTKTFCNLYDKGSQLTSGVSVKKSINSAKQFFLFLPIICP